MIPDKFKGLLGILKSKLDMGLSESTGMQRITSEEVNGLRGQAFLYCLMGWNWRGDSVSHAKR